MLTLLRDLALAQHGWRRTDKGRLCRVINGMRQTVFATKPGQWKVCIAEGTKVPWYCGPYKSERRAIEMADVVADC